MNTKGDVEERREDEGVRDTERDVHVFVERHHFGYGHRERQYRGRQWRCRRCGGRSDSDGVGVIACAEEDACEGVRKG